MVDYPNVLIINDQSIYKDNATGITLRSLWEKWPKEKLLEFHIDPKRIEKKDRWDSCCIINAFPVQKLMRKVGNRERRGVSATVSDTTNQKNTIKSRIRRLLINFSDISAMFITKNISKKIESFSPNVIYTLGASVSAMKMAVYVSEKYNIPIIVHFMDDWPHFLQDEAGIGQRFYKKKLQKWLRKCYEHSRIAIGISPQMATAYECETGTRHVALMNAVDTANLFCPALNLEDEIRFIYTGGLHLRRWEALLEIQDAIKNKMSSSQIRGKLLIFTKLKDIIDIMNQFDPHITSFYDYVSHDEIKSVYQNAHVLVHAEVTDPLLIGYFRYSISTKIPEYLATNRPMLFFGPKEMGLSDYLKNNGCAYVANNRQELNACIGRFFDDYDLTKEICAKGRMVAQNNHDLLKSQETLRNCICVSCETELGE